MAKEHIIIVEDEWVIAGDIASFLKSLDYTVVGIAYDSETALDKIHQYRPDLVLLDIHIDGSKDGIEIAVILKNKYKIPFIFLTSFSDDLTLRKALLSNPAGYIVKPFDEQSLKTTIATALYNHKTNSSQGILKKEQIEEITNSSITEREFEILRDLCKGMTNPELAREHFVSRNTIKYHLKNLFIKLGVSNRMELIQKVLRS